MEWHTMATNKMKTAKITIDNLTGGWTNDFQKLTNGSAFQKKLYTYESGKLFLSRGGYLGQISGSIADTNVVSQFLSSYPIAGTKISENVAHFIQKDGIIGIMDSENDNSIFFRPAPTNCADNEYKDIFKGTWNGNAGSFFTYTTTGNQAFVGFMYADGNTRQDSLYTFTNGLVPHTGVKSVANKSFFTDGEYIVVYDNISNQFTNTVNIGKGWTLQDLADYGNYVAGIATDGADSRLFLWDGLGTAYNFQYEIRDFTATAIVNDGGELRVFTQGKNDTMKIKTFSNGFNEESDIEIPISSVVNSPRYNMIDTWLNQIVWRNYNGDLFMYGTPKKNEFSTGFHKVGSTSSSGFGMCKNLYRDLLYQGIDSSPNDSLTYINPKTSEGTATLKTAMYPLPRGATISRIDLDLDYTISGNTTTASDLNIKLYAGYDGVLRLDESIAEDDALQGTKLTRHTILQTIPEIDKFYLELTFFKTIIRKIEVYYNYDELSI